MQQNYNNLDIFKQDIDNGIEFKSLHYLYDSISDMPIIEQLQALLYCQGYRLNKSIEQLNSLKNNKEDWINKIKRQNKEQFYELLIKFCEYDIEHKPKNIQDIIFLIDIYNNDTMNKFVKNKIYNVKNWKGSLFSYGTRAEGEIKCKRAKIIDNSTFYNCYNTFIITHGEYINGYVIVSPMSRKFKNEYILIPIGNIIDY